MKVLATLALLSSAAAFAPVQQGQTSTQLNAFEPSKQLGAIPPVGFFDPLGLVESGPYGSTEENFLHYRGVELKHGRIAMAATLGMLVQQNYHFSGYVSPSMDLKFEDVPNGLGALSVIPLIGWVQLAVTIGAHELAIKPTGTKPGDFGTGYFGISLNDESSKQLRALNIELSNGRLAMLGILGMFASEVVNGKPLAETTIFS